MTMSPPKAHHFRAGSVDSRDPATANLKPERSLALLSVDNSVVSNLEIKQANLGGTKIDHSMISLGSAALDKHVRSRLTERKESPIKVTEMRLDPSNSRLNL